MKKKNSEYRKSYKKCRKNCEKKAAELTTQEAFLFHHKRHQNRVLLLRILLLVFFLLLWEISSRLKWIDSFFFASPSIVATCCARMAIDGTLFFNIGITLVETLLSFFFVIAIGIGVATLLWYCKSASEVLEPYLVILNSLPKSALAPLFIVWLGTGMKTIVVAGVSVAVFGCIISIYTSFCQVDPEEMKLIYTLGGRKRDVFCKVVFPSSIPTILSTMKVNIGLALVGVIIGEFLAARRGLGYLIIYGSQVFQLNMVITSILILCLIAVALYQAIRQLEKYYEKKM